MNLYEPLISPSGVIIPDRIAKAAMEENMADDDHALSDGLMRLYQAWADGGAGLIITGNIMVDRRAMTGPRGVVLEDEAHLDRFKRWADIGRSKGSQFWLQINHPGRQMQANLRQKNMGTFCRAIGFGKPLFAVQSTAGNVGADDSGRDPTICKHGSTR